MKPLHAEALFWGMFFGRGDLPKDVAAVARQLGVTRQSVYKRIRDAELILGVESAVKRDPVKSERSKRARSLWMHEIFKDVPADKRPKSLSTP